MGAGDRVGAWDGAKERVGDAVVTVGDSLTIAAVVCSVSKPLSNSVGTTLVGDPDGMRVGARVGWRFGERVGGRFGERVGLRVDAPSVSGTLGCTVGQGSFSVSLLSSPLLDDFDFDDHDDLE